MEVFYSFFVFIFGAVIGSFLNVVILRLQQRKTLSGRSECPHCHHQLQSIDLVPIVSYLTLSGKCRYCGHRLSVQYPLVESLTAIAFTLVFWFSPLSSTISWLTAVEFVFALFVTAVLIVVSVYDLRWGLIPDKVILPGVLLAFVYQFVVLVLLLAAQKPEFVTVAGSFTDSPWFSFGIDILMAAGIGLFFFTLIAATKGKGMGGGDLKLSIFIGLALGFPGAIIALLLAFLTGALASLILLLSGKKGLKSTVAFGPFLALGAFLAIIVGSSLWSAYLHLLGFN